MFVALVLFQRLPLLKFRFHAFVAEFSVVSMTYLVLTQWECIDHSIKEIALSHHP
nr:MAG TPA: hypothetical protein [Bacteriophage sp.]